VRGDDERAEGLVLIELLETRIEGAEEICTYDDVVFGGGRVDGNDRHSAFIVSREGGLGSVLSSQFSVLSSQFSVLSSQLEEP